MAVSGMTVLTLVLVGMGSGWLGAVIGIGGGIIIVPALSLGFGVDIRIAVATSLAGVIATSTAAGSVYVSKGLANMRLGMTLEVATTLGGITGGLIAVMISGPLISGIFALMMLPTAYLVLKKKDVASAKGGDGASADEDAPKHGYEAHGKLEGAYFDEKEGRLIPYRAERVGLGAGISFVAGILSGLLGLGGGFLKVPAMAVGMKVPIRVAAATSNFMIGVTAISSFFVYLARGYVHPLWVVPLVTGVIMGSSLGVKMSGKIPAQQLRRLLAVILVIVSFQMGYKALSSFL